MFKAIGRWFKAVGYLLTGQIDSARRTLDTNPHVVRSKYDSIVRDKIDQIHTYKQAVAGLIAQQENKIARVKELTADVERLERLKAGALAKAKQTVEAMQQSGKSMEEIHASEDYRKCLNAFNDFKSTLSEKQERITEAEGDIGNYSKSIQEHKVQLQQLLRDLDKLKAESADAVAEIITAKQEKELAETLTGIAKDGSSEELQHLRQMRQELKAEARISKEMAGVDSKAQEAEFLEYARRSEGTNEFDALLGLGTSTPAKPSQEKGSGLPE